MKCPQCGHRSGMSDEQLGGLLEWVAFSSLLIVIGVLIALT